VYNEPDTLENVFLRSAGLDLIMARAWARLSFGTAPNFKAAAYWMVSLLPWWVVSLLVSCSP